MRKLTPWILLGCVAALTAVDAAADCAVSGPLACEGPIGEIVNDPVSRDVFFRMTTLDESNLDCTPSGPDVLENSALRLSRSSPVFQENYQLVLLATASTSNVRVTMRNPASVPGGLCEVDTIVLDSVL